MLALFTELRRLHIMAAAVDAETLRRFPNLEYLLICSLPNDAALEQLGVFTKLRTLLVYDSTNVTGSGLKMLARMPRLELVHLENSGIDNEALKHLSLAPKLTVLNLTNLPKVTAEGLPHLTKLKLKRLEIWARGISSKLIAGDMKKLAGALPGCQIIWNGGVDPRK